MENPTSKLGKGKWTSNSVGCLRDKEEKGVSKDIYSSGTSVVLTGTSGAPLCSFAERKLPSLCVGSSFTVSIDDGKVVGVCF
eukprot:2409683-Amphidinium_carterae.1